MRVWLKNYRRKYMQLKYHYLTYHHQMVFPIKKQKCIQTKLFKTIFDTEK